VQLPQVVRRKGDGADGRAHGSAREESGGDVIGRRKIK
jgi:hypothetical protein